MSQLIKRILARFRQNPRPVRSAFRPDGSGRRLLQGALDGGCDRGVLGVGPTRTYCTAIGTGMCWLAIVSYGVALDGSCLGDDSLKKSLPPKCPDTT